MVNQIPSLVFVAIRCIKARKACSFCGKTNHVFATCQWKQSFEKGFMCFGKKKARPAPLQNSHKDYLAKSRRKGIWWKYVGNFILISFPRRRVRLCKYGCRRSCIRVFQIPQPVQRHRRKKPTPQAVGN